MAQLWYKPSPPGEVHDTPWLSPDATRYLESLLRPDMHVLEHGSGGSTIWLAKRGELVTAVEHDPDCHRAVKSVAPSNANVILWDKPRLPKLRPPYDLVLVDGEPVEERAYYIRAAEKLVKPGGVFVLGNFNRPEYQAEREALEKRHRHLEFRFSFGLYLNTQFFFIGQKP